MKNTLLDNFYTETSSTFTPGAAEFKCQIDLNSSHPVYKGHFPQIPVVPGVCLTQMIKEILMEKLNQDLVMTSGDNIKFLAMINPKETPSLEISFTVKPSESGWDVSASYTTTSSTFVKFKGKFIAA